MKTLLLVRHAKSSWDDLSLPDFDRPLNDRGRNDAPKMAKRLLNRGVKIDAFVSSPARRAKKTAKYFSEEYGRDKNEIMLIPELYEAGVKDFWHAVKNLKNKFNSAAIFSHNPGITLFANTLSSGAGIDNMPTCSVFAVTADINDWTAFEQAEKKFLFFDYPKKAD